MIQDKLEASELKTFYWHYAWVVVAIIGGMQIVGTSIRMAFGVFIEPLQNQFGWSQGAIGFAYAICSIVSAVVSPWAGNLGDRVGAKKSMLVGTFVFLIGMLTTAFVKSLWQFWLTFGVILGIAQAIFLVPLIPAAMIWFRRHLGLAMGLIMASWGIGPALATPLVAFMIQTFGWTVAFVSIGIASTLIMLALVSVFKNRPTDVGLMAYGTFKSDPPLSDRLPPAILLDEFKRHMKKTTAYWNMSSIHFLGCVGHAVILIWIIPMATSKGMNLIDASLILTLFSAVSIVSRLTTPVLCERLGVRTVMTGFYILQGAPVLLLIFSSMDGWEFLIFAVSFGIGYGGETGGFPILNRKYFGHAPMGGAHGFQMLGAGMGMAFGGWIGGPVFDIFDSYNAAFAISVVASFAGAVSIILLENPAKLLIPDWQKLEDEFEPNLKIAT
jgi:MFS family permease